MRAMGEELVLTTGGTVTAPDPVLEQARADLRDLTVAQSIALSRTATTIAAAATASREGDDR